MKIIMFVCLLVVVFFPSILNKLTPDNFEKLSREFIHHACNSSREIRKGAIVLVRYSVDLQGLVFGSYSAGNSNWPVVHF